MRVPIRRVRLVKPKPQPAAEWQSRNPLQWSRKMWLSTGVLKSPATSAQRRGRLVDPSPGHPRFDLALLVLGHELRRGPGAEAQDRLEPLARRLEVDAREVETAERRLEPVADHGARARELPHVLRVARRHVEEGEAAEQRHAALDVPVPPRRGVDRLVAGLLEHDHVGRLQRHHQAQGAGLDATAHVPGGDADARFAAGSVDEAAPREAQPEQRLGEQGRGHDEGSGEAPVGDRAGGEQERQRQGEHPPGPEQEQRDRPEPLARPPDERRERQ